MISYQALREFLRQSVLARVGFIAGLILVVAALLAPWIAPADPAAQNLPARLESPSRAHWMGTDELGRDILSRTLYGARISLLVSVCVVCGCGLIGLTMGMLAGYAGGWWDRVINLLLVNAFLSFPGILLAIAFAAFLGPGIGKVILALIITGWAGYARLARAHHGAASTAQHFAAHPDSSHHRDGRGDPRGINVEFSRARRARTHSQLGSDAE